MSYQGDLNPMMPHTYPWVADGPRNGPKSLGSGYSVIERVAFVSKITGQADEPYDFRFAWYTNLVDAEDVIRRGAANGVTSRSILRDQDGMVMHLAKDLMVGPYLIGEVAR